jgi:hypothetical protein
MQQKKGSAPKKDGQIGKKEEQGRRDTMTQEALSTTNLQEIGPPK